MKCFLRFSAAVVLMLLKAAGLCGQNPSAFPKVQQADGVFRHFYSGDGLSHHNITFLLQDSRDFLWACSSDGLNRLDGKNIRSFFHDALNAGSISTNNCRMMAENSRGELIVSTENGLNTYSHGSNRFHLVFKPAGGKPADLLYRDPAGHLWLSSEEKLLELDENYHLLKDWTKQLAGSGNVDIICAANEESILVSKGGWINLIQLKKNSVQNHKTNPHGLDFLKEKIRHIAFENNKLGGFWILTANSQLKHFHKNGLLLHSTQTNPALLFHRLYLSKNNELWIGSQGKGLFRYNESTGGFFQYSHRSGDPYSISGNYINGLLEDRAGNFWVYTSNGLDVMQKTDPAFRIMREFGMEKYLRDMPVTLSSACSGKKGIWIGTWGNGLFHKSLPDQNGEYISGGKAEMENLVWDLLPDPDGLWFSTYGGLHRYSFSTKQVISARSWPHYPVKRDSIAVIKLFRDSRQNVWASFLGNYGMMKMSADGKTMRYFRQDQSKGFTLPHFDAIAEDAAGKLWFGHKNRRGIVVYDPQKDAFQPLFNFSDFSNCLLADGNHMWLGSKNGLFRLDGQGKITHHLTRKDGLPNNQINVLAKDLKGRIWAGTDNGLFYCNTDFTIRQIALPEAEKEEEIRDAKLDVSSGRIHLVCTHRIVSFHPDSLHLQHPVLKPTLTRMLAGGLPRDFSAGKIILPDGAGRLISFEFDAPCFFLEDPVRFSWMLKGLDSGWSAESQGNVASYSNLPPGKYAFHLRASPDGKKWFSANEPVSFEIEVPFFRQSWFLNLALVVLFVLLTLALVIYYRIRLAKIRFGHQIRNKISEDIHDDISLGLTRIVWQTEMLLGKQKNSRDDLNEHLQSILFSARDTASKLSEIVWAVNPEHDNLEAFLSYLRNYSASLMEELGLAYEIDFPDNAPARKLDSNLIRNLFLMVKELLNNAIRHSGASKIRVAFILLPAGNYCMEVSDNGCGFLQEDKEKQGNGLSNLKSRSGKINAEIGFETSPGNGCTVWISGPLF